MQLTHVSILGKATCRVHRGIYGSIAISHPIYVSNGQHIRVFRPVYQSIFLAFPWKVFYPQGNSVPVQDLVEVLSYQNKSYERTLHLCIVQMVESSVASVCYGHAYQCSYILVF